MTAGQAIPLPLGELRRIGSAELTRPEIFRNEPEAASWFQDVSCMPQTVALLCDGAEVQFAFEGTIVRTTYPSLVRPGIARGAGVGGLGTHKIQSHAHVIAAEIAHPVGFEGIAFALDRGYGVDSEHLGGRDGAAARTRGVFTIPAAGHPLQVVSKRYDESGRNFSRPLHTFRVTYGGKDCGEVTVSSSRDERYRVHARALRAAERHVFTQFG